MNALIRKLAVLSVLWAVCEMLLPDGKQQQMVRMTLGVLVMTALLSAAGDAATQARLLPSAPAFWEQTAQVSQESYRRTALTAAANQMKSWCERFCQKAGYTAQAMVTLGMDGKVQDISLTLDQPLAPLMTPSELVQAMAKQLDLSVIRLSDAP